MSNPNSISDQHYPNFTLLPPLHFNFHHLDTLYQTPPKTMDHLHSFIITPKHRITQFPISSSKNLIHLYILKPKIPNMPTTFLKTHSSSKKLFVTIFFSNNQPSPIWMLYYMLSFYSFFYFFSTLPLINILFLQNLIFFS